MRQIDDISQIALNIARNCGWHVFPCRADNKAPMTKRGFHDARNASSEILRLPWQTDALIGIRTGEASGISVLDVDIKHAEACGWWRLNERHLPHTRTYRTRGGGLHLYFQHCPGVRNSEANPVLGIDVRGQGGYVIHWFAQPSALWPFLRTMAG